jgi:streptogramin lyase
VWALEEDAAVPVVDRKPGRPLLLDEEPSDFAVDGDDMWVVQPSGLQRYDTAKRTPVGGPIDVDAVDGARVALGEGGVWISDEVAGTIVRIDPETSRADDPIKMEIDVDGPLAVGEGAIWVLSAEIGDDGGIWVTPVDPRSGRLSDPIRVGAYDDGRTLAVGGGWVWVSDPADNSVRRIDPKTRKLAPERIPLNGGASSLTVGGGALFALDGLGETLLRIDPKTAKPVGEPVPVAAGAGGRVAAGDDDAWVSSLNRRSLLRLSW